MRVLRNSQSVMTKKYLGPFQQSLSGIIAKAEDSGSDDPYFSDDHAKSVGLKLLKRGTSTSKSSGSLRSSSSARSVELFDQTVDNDDDQFVLMRSLSTKPFKSPVGGMLQPAKAAATAMQKSVSFAPKSTSPRPMLSTSHSSPSKSDPASLKRTSTDHTANVGESIIIIDSEDKVSEGLRLRSSQSSKTSNSRSSRYSPSDEASDFDDYNSESKGSTARESTSKVDWSLADSSDAKDNSDAMDSSEYSGSKMRSKTLDSTISDLTLSGIHEGRVNLQKRGSQESEGPHNFHEQSSDIDKIAGFSSALQGTDLKKPPIVSTTQTPLTNSSTISPFADLRENDEDDASESLALSESNDAFPFLEESQDD